ncbi:MAG: polysaccharide biosynthesis tyrosine autokinase [Planctomycetota bacterium]|nr:polysaccharide biosynthesis tyrosine autokinase [Planctomycetota bacterium]
MSYEDANEAFDLPAANMSGTVLELMRFLRVVWYRKSTVVVTFIVVALVSAWYAATATRYYESSASILILQSGSQDMTPALGIDGSDQRLMPTYRQLLTSQPVMEGAIVHLPKEYYGEFSGRPREHWFKELAENVRVSVISNTKVLDVVYRSKDPLAAAAVVRAIIQSYLGFIDKTHKGTAAEILDVLTHEKEHLAGKLAAKEAELLAARKASGDFGIREGSTVVHPLVQTAISLNEALIEARKERLTQESMLTAVEQAVRQGEDLQQYLMVVEASVGREILMTGLGFNTQDARVQSELERNLLEDYAELKSLSVDYGPAHPRITEVQHRIQTTNQYLRDHSDQVRRQLADLQSSQLGPMLIRMIQQSHSKAYQKEAALRKSFEEARQQAVQLQGNVAQLDILSHTVQRLRNLHDVLVDRIANTDLRQAQGDIRATIVQEPTVSHRPVSPQLWRVGLVCLMATAGIGVGLVYLQDIVDDRFRTPDELDMRVGAQLLAMIRKLNIAEAEGIESLHANVAPNSAETESFRTLRTSLALSASETNRVVMTSSEPGDGKTTVIANLAVVYAQSGKRTLLIDADLRRPGLTRMLAMKGMLGLSDVLTSSESIDDVLGRSVVCTDLPSLDVLPAGPRRQDPSELLASERMADLLAWAETAYDQILIDSPPVLAASDAILLGRLVDGAILVVRPEKNRRRLVYRALESLNGAGINLFGIIANCISEGNGFGYGDTYGYGYGYNYGYGSDEDEEPAAHDEALPIIEFDGAAQTRYEDERYYTEPSLTIPRRAG